MPDFHEAFDRGEPDANAGERTRAAGDRPGIHLLELQAGAPRQGIHGAEELGGVAAGFQRHGGALGPVLKEGQAAVRGSRLEAMSHICNSVRWDGAARGRPRATLPRARGGSPGLRSSRRHPAAGANSARAIRGAPARTAAGHLVQWAERDAGDGANAANAAVLGSEAAASRGAAAVPPGRFLRAVL